MKRSWGVVLHHSSKQILQMLGGNVRMPALRWRTGITVRREATAAVADAAPRPSSWWMGRWRGGERLGSSKTGARRRFRVSRGGAHSHPPPRRASFGHRVAAVSSGFCARLRTAGGPGRPALPEGPVVHHRASSGPSGQISSHWRLGESVQVDLIPT